MDPETLSADCRQLVRCWINQNCTFTLIRVGHLCGLFDSKLHQTMRCTQYCSTQPLTRNISSTQFKWFCLTQQVFLKGKRFLKGQPIKNGLWTPWMNYRTSRQNPSINSGTVKLNFTGIGHSQSWHYICIYPVANCTFFTEHNLQRNCLLKGTSYENNNFPGNWGVVLGLWCSHTHTNFEKKSVHDFWSEICISESTPPTVTKRASQFRHPFLRRKGAQLNITCHFPTPLQSEHC